ncbi:hypothetical protein [Hydrotalea sp.]|uniref:hypothetical protein n=1 Tax=Hydrotalea sp. TaxID=2881279 RepID=UPI002625A6D1|nr:hypothetical protein [Hydrotalea sp.]
MTQRTKHQFSISEDTILHYLEGNLTDEDMHAFEEEMEASDFLREAIEGLENFADKKALRAAVKQLQKQLEKRTSHSRKKRYQLFQQHQLQNIILVVVILLLIFLGVVVVRFLKFHPLLK